MSGNQVLGLGHPDGWGEQLLRDQQRERTREEQRCRLPGPIGTTPPQISCRRLLAGSQGGRTVLYEYEDGKRLMKLLYPNDQKRAFYQEGDIVLLSDMRPKDAAMQFPELAGESESTILILAMGFLGEEPPDYKVGWKIQRMGAESPPGNANLSLVGVIFFDRDVVELSRTRDLTARELGLEFQLWGKLASTLGPWIPILQAVGEIATQACGGVLRHATKRVARYTLRHALRITARRALLRRALRIGLGSGVRLSVETAAAFVRGFVAKLRQTNAENELRKKAGASPLDISDLRPYIAAGVEAAVGHLLDAAGKFITAQLQRGMAEMFEPAEFKHQVAAYVTEQVVLSFTTRPAGLIASVTTEAYQASLRGESFSDALGKALSALVLDPFKQALEQLIEKAEK